MSFLGPPSRRRRGKARPGSRFQRTRRPGEELAGRLIQVVVLTGLTAALLWLLIVTSRLVQARLMEKYGSQAWLLPVIIGLVFLFILYRFQRLWAEVIGRVGELRELRKLKKYKGDKQDG